MRLPGTLALLSLTCLSENWLASARSFEIPASRTYFYTGGRYIDDGTGMHLFSDQMYVEHLMPASGVSADYPIVFVHGQAQTGTNWLNTPDNREGWASWFLSRGYEVYIIDQPQRGRSAYLPGYGNLSTYSAETISMLFTGVQNFDLWPQAHLHTQWPGDTVQNLTQQAGSSLLDTIGPANLIVHSQAGPLGFLIADARPSLVKKMVILEPEGPPFQNRIVNTAEGGTVRPYGLTTIPLTYDPPVFNPATDLPTVEIPPQAAGLTDCIRQQTPAKRLPNLAQVPMLVVTSEASFHAAYDYCTVQYLQQAGVPAQFLNLSQVGFHGNAHFIFLEKNNLEIAAEVESWIGGAASNKPSG